MDIEKQLKALPAAEIETLVKDRKFILWSHIVYQDPQLGTEAVGIAGVTDQLITFLFLSEQQPTLSAAQELTIPFSELEVGEGPTGLGKTGVGFRRKIDGNGVAIVAFLENLDQVTANTYPALAQTSWPKWAQFFKQHGLMVEDVKASNGLTKQWKRFWIITVVIVVVCVAAVLAGNHRFSQEKTRTRTITDKTLQALNSNDSEGLLKTMCNGSIAKAEADEILAHYQKNEFSTKLQTSEATFETQDPNMRVFYGSGQTATQPSGTAPVDLGVSTLVDRKNPSCTQDLVVYFPEGTFSIH